MPEYVYAVHEFLPQHPDEISFKVGEKIEVLEKDEVYNDGWWQGRNTEGKVGLFPESYTSASLPKSTVDFPAETPSSSNQPNNVPAISLHTLHEEPESNGTGTSPEADERNRTLSGDGEMMRATLTDVQQAIEQLGRNDHDGTRSFSFASSHGDYTDRSETETDHEDEADDEDWHKGVREKLAARAKQENDERAARAAAEASLPSTPIRSTAPPIDVELSDESEDEEEEEPVQRVLKRHSDPYIPSTSRIPSHIPEEDEEEQDQDQDNQQQVAEHVHVQALAVSQPPLSAVALPIPQPAVAAPATPEVESTHIIPSEDFIVPHPMEDESGLRTATADRSTFLSPILDAFPEVSPSASSAPPLPSAIVAAIPAKPSSPKSMSPPRSPPPPARVGSPKSPRTRSPEPKPPKRTVETPPPLKAVPSAIRVGEQLPHTASSALPSPAVSTSGSTGMSSMSMQQTLTPATTITSLKNATASPAQSEKRSSTQEAPKSAKHPSEWNEQEVIEWLKSKGFDQGVCDKFIEQEITGDVLLELDANVLKSEIGITAYGKRVRIANAIAELRRPPSISETEPNPPLPSRTQSGNYSHSHTPSMQSSAQHSYSSSPFSYVPPQFSPASSHIGFGPSVSVPPGPGLSTIISHDSSPLPSEYAIKAANGWRSSDPGSTTQQTVLHDSPESLHQQPKEAVGLGLGMPTSASVPIMNGKSAKRPAYLNLSPSDGALKASATLEAQSPLTAASEDRIAMSDTETAHTPDAKSKRRRLFGRSADSGSLKEKASSLKDTSSRHSRDTPSTPISHLPSDAKQEITETPPTRRHSKKKSVDERKASDRLSLFGTSFTSTLGKGRKPVPRLSAGGDEASPAKTGGALATFSRMRNHSERKTSSSSGRPSTSDGTPRKQKDEEKEEKAFKDSSASVKGHHHSILRKRTASTVDVPVRPAVASVQAAGGPTLKPGKSILEQIGTPDHNGWMRKKSDRYNTWKLRYFVLKGPHLYCLRSNNKSETKIKGYINIHGYKVLADENADPGRYGFRIVHESDKTHYFSSDEHIVIREWMKALMKATITRDYANPVVSSSNIPTIPLTVAQAMNPAPRPPSPTARAATQRAHRRENPNQLSSRDAEILLMSMPGKEKSMNGKNNNDKVRLDSFFDSSSVNGQDSKKSPTTPKSPPPRPSRETRRFSSNNDSQTQLPQAPGDIALIEWANSHLPKSLQATLGSTFSGLALLRLAEDIKGKPCSPPIPDSAFPSGPNDDKLDGLFKLFDFLLDNDVKMGMVSINDIRQGKRDKVMQVLRALRQWEEKRKAIAHSIGKGSITAGPFMAMAPVEYF
ncbi:hypothetical protein ABKN59_001635 [Abortiporus biennis]